MAATEAGTRTARTLDDLYRVHAAEVYRYAYAVLGNAADAEDVTQTTFMNALRALERGEVPLKPSHWLIAIAHNLVRQRFRQQARAPTQVELLHEHTAGAARVTSDPSLDDLVRALQQIPPAQREALVMRELEGRPYAEIAEILGISSGALETLLFRARRSLTDELENLVTCNGAELALSRQRDGMLSRKERRRLESHMRECQRCSRLAATRSAQGRAWKGLAVLPLPVAFTLVKGTPTASAAASATGVTVLPTVGSATAVGAGGGAAAGGVTVGAVAAKVAAVVVAATVVGGVGYQGTRLVRDDQSSPPAPSRTAGTPSVKRIPASVDASTKRVPTAERNQPTTAPGEHSTSDAPPAGTGLGAVASLHGVRADADIPPPAPRPAVGASHREPPSPGSGAAAPASPTAGGASAPTGNTPKQATPTAHATGKPAVPPAAAPPAEPPAETGQATAPGQVKKTTPTPEKTKNPKAAIGKGEAKHVEIVPAESADGDKQSGKTGPEEPTADPAAETAGGATQAPTGEAAASGPGEPASPGNSHAVKTK